MVCTSRFPTLLLVYVCVTAAITMPHYTEYATSGCVSDTCQSDAAALLQGHVRKVEAALGTSAGSKDGNNEKDAGSEKKQEGAASLVENKCSQSLVIDIGNGLDGGESLRDFFQLNGFKALFYTDNGRSEHNGGNRLDKMVAQDLAHGQYQLPTLFHQLNQSMAEAAKQTNGNLFIGDLKPYLWPGEGERIGEVFAQIRTRFPTATFVWPLRHPIKWATSMTHFIDEASLSTAQLRESFLQGVQCAWLKSNCAILNAFADVVHQLPLLGVDAVDFPRFLTAMRQISPSYSCLKGELPHSGHHKPKHVYQANITGWDPLPYLQERCLDDSAWRSQCGDSYLERSVPRAGSEWFVFAEGKPSRKSVTG